MCACAWCLCVYVILGTYSSRNQEHSLKKRRAISASSSLVNGCCVVCCYSVYLYPTVSFQRCGSHSTTAAVPQGFIFATAIIRCLGGYACMRVCVRAIPAHKLDAYNPRFLWSSKHTSSTATATAAAAAAPAAVQHQRTSYRLIS